MIGPWALEGEWLRCQFHCHTTNSDGDPSPEALCDHYAEAGFDVLGISDHWHITRCEHPSLLLIQAAELSARVPPLVKDAGELTLDEADVLAIGIDVLPEMRESFPTVEECAQWINTAGGVAFLAHPNWSMLLPEHLLEAPSLAGLEVWNGASELTQGNGLSSVYWDDVLQRGARPPGLATDDSHSAGRDSLVGWTWVRAGERSSGAVVAALREGAFYGSAGPRLDGVWIADDGTVGVRCSPAASVYLRSGPWDGCSAHGDPSRLSYGGRVVETDADGLVVEASLDFPFFWRWARVEVVDVAGRRAWSNAFDLPERPAPADAGASS